jgi:hypothetical protein
LGRLFAHFATTSAVAGMRQMQNPQQIARQAKYFDLAPYSTCNQPLSAKEKWPVYYAQSRNLEIDTNSSDTRPEPPK